MYNEFQKPYRPKELTEKRKAESDIKNDTDELTFESRNNNARAAAYLENRNKADDKVISELEKNDEELMLAELELMERDYING